MQWLKLWRDCDSRLPCVVEESRNSRGPHKSRDGRIAVASHCCNSCFSHDGRRPLSNLSRPSAPLPSVTANRITYANWYRGPAYLSDQLQHVAQVESRRRLRSSSSPVLIVPATRRSSLGDRAFSVAAARAWNGTVCRQQSPLRQLSLFIPPSAENSSIYWVFPVISVTLLIVWVSSTSLTVLSDLVVVWLYVSHHNVFVLHYIKSTKTRRMPAAHIRAGKN